MPHDLWRELAIRRAARKDVLAYASAIEIPGKPATDDPDAEFFQPVETRIAAHHRLLLAKLDHVAATPHGRLMVFMPPGSAKSSYASVVFPSRYLGQAPNRQIILASYASDLARKMGRRLRSIIKQPRYRGIWECGLTAESSAADQFTLTNGSGFMAGGILSGITGNRANGLIIDDPLRGREDAESDAILNKTWDAYNDDLLTRLVPGGFVVIIQTRWSKRDLAGRILPDDWAGESGPILCRDGNVWEVICLQARCEVDNDPLGRQRGEYLWPEWFTRSHWAQFEHNQRTWSSLFQQLPSPPSGNFFKPDRIAVIDAVPVGTRFVRGWDLAATADAGDWTAGYKLGIQPNGRYLIADEVYLQGSADEVRAAITNAASRDGKTVRISLPQDPGQAGKAQVSSFAKMLAGYTVEFSTETGAKTTRAEPFASQVNVGNVDMLRAGWNDGLIEELRPFPFGSLDNRVDSLSRAFNALTGGTAGLLDYYRQQAEAMAKKD